jgi:hypothetical protein
MVMPLGPNGAVWVARVAECPSSLPRIRNESQAQSTFLMAVRGLEAWATTPVDSMPATAVGCGNGRNVEVYWRARCR